MPKRRLVLASVFLLIVELSPFAYAQQDISFAIPHGPVKRVKKVLVVVRKKVPRTGNTTTSEKATTQDLADLSAKVYTGGIAQIARGITKVSAGAQDKKSNGSTEENRELIATGLNVMASGVDDVSKAQDILDQANEIEKANYNLSDIGTSESYEPMSLSASKNNIGSTVSSVLDKMEEVSNVSSDKLLETINSEGNVYDVAAGAKGLNMKPSEIQTAAELTIQKMGKPSNPEITEDMKLSDVVKDLEMFFKKSETDSSSLTVDNKEVPTPIAAEAPKPFLNANITKANLETINEEKPFVLGQEQAVDPKIFFQEEKTIFEMIKYQYNKRRYDFPKVSILN